MGCGGYTTAISTIILCRYEYEVIIIHNVAVRIAAFLCAEEIISKEQEDICIYGTELLMSSLIEVINVCIAGAVFGTFWQSMLYLICMMAVRSYTGGYHADSYLRCNAAFIAAYAGTVGIWFICKSFSVSVWMWLPVLLAFIYIIKEAPIENRNKILTPFEKRKYKKISVCVYLGFLAVAAGMDIADNQKGISLISLYIKILLTTIAVFMIIGKKKNDRICCGKERT